LFSAVDAESFETLREGFISVVMGLQRFVHGITGNESMKERTKYRSSSYSVIEQQ
jgi:hypothetical protein